LDDGTKLTLRDAIQYLANTVSKAEQNDEKVLVAADHLTRFAEQGYPLYFARAATLRATYRNKEPVFNPQGSPLGQAQAEERTEAVGTYRT
jgi:hypothetical protein